MLQFEKQEKAWDENWHLVQVTELWFCGWCARFPCRGGFREWQGTNWAGFEISCGLPETLPFSAPPHRAHSGPFLCNPPLVHPAPALGRCAAMWILDSWLKDKFRSSWLLFLESSGLPFFSVPGSFSSFFPVCPLLFSSLFNFLPFSGSTEIFNMKIWTN